MGEEKKPFCRGGGPCEKGKGKERGREREGRGREGNNGRGEKNLFVEEEVHVIFLNGCGFSFVSVVMEKRKKEGRRRGEEERKERMGRTGG